MDFELLGLDIMGRCRQRVTTWEVQVAHPSPNFESSPRQATKVSSLGSSPLDNSPFNGAKHRYTIIPTKDCQYKGEHPGLEPKV